MTKLKTFAVTALAAATIGVGGLAAAPTASAAPMSCSQVNAVYQAYRAAGNVFYGLGDYVTAFYWYGKADAVMDAGC